MCAVECLALRLRLRAADSTKEALAFVTEHSALGTERCVSELYITAVVALDVNICSEF